MRIVHAFAFAAAVGLSVSASTSAFAEGSIAPTLSKPAAAAGQGWLRLSPTEARQMRGTFRLDDGRVLVVRNEGARLLAEFDGKREMLVRTADHRFAARNSGVEFEFNRVPYPEEVVLRQAAR